jgi:hypothetical protein
MTDAAQLQYESLKTVAAVERLIADGESEGLYLEAKSVSEPRFGRGIKNQTAETASAMANTEGGVILYGVGTVKHVHGGFDVLTHLEPMANVDSFVRAMVAAVPQLHAPAITAFKAKALRKRGQTSGLAVLHIPRTSSGPVRCTYDNQFYMRSGGDDVVAPYDMIRRLFAATDVPDLSPVFADHLMTLGEDGVWTLRLAVENHSSAIARDVHVTLTLDDADACEIVRLQHFIDQAELNQSRRVFMLDLGHPLHRGLPTVVGAVSLKMQKGTRARRSLRFTVSLFADRMIAKAWQYTAHLSSTGFRLVKTDGPHPLY